VNCKNEGKKQEKRAYISSKPPDIHVAITTHIIQIAMYLCMAFRQLRGKKKFVK